MANLPMPEPSATNVAFTRYLYDKTEVLHSLLFALLDHNRHEALFWAYELYYSGFEIELAEWLRWTYYVFYSEVDKWFCEFIEINLRRLHTLPIKEERDCIIGTVVSNLAHRSYDIQAFVGHYMNLEFDRTTPKIHNHRIYIQFKPRDLEKYLTLNKSTTGRPRDYLKEVSHYPIRKSESLFLRKYVYASNEHVFTEDTVDPYLYNWLYYAGKSPIWKCRISEYGGVLDNTEQVVAFPTDDQAELFFEEYGYEPDEQSVEIHLLHGIDINQSQVFAEQCPHEFVFNYSDGRICQYSAIVRTDDV
jgi:hypothetical protein